ncbi:MAG: response regulator [Desulfobacterales bacterium]|nr:response regulator [Desulfobacterales bacterium]
MEFDLNHSPTDIQVLIADDDQLAAKAFQRMLAADGRAVHVANNFTDAAGLLQAQRFDALLVDIFLGQDDGITLLELSKDVQPDTPVILITGKPTVETASAAVRLKAYDYLSKPISKDRLCHTVAKALEIKHLRSAKKKIELENQRYQQDLEALVTARTEKLIQSNLRYQLLFENSKDAIFMASRQGHFLAINEAAVQLFGYERAELPRVRATLLWAEAGEYERFQREIETQGFVKDFAVRFAKKDGMILDCLLTANLLHHPEGPIEGYQGIIRDITDKKRLESVAEAANLMENLGYIFSGIRHEIGNPINSIKMALSVLSIHLDRYPPETIRQFVERAMGEVTRVEYLLKALKNFSMYETTELEPMAMEPFMRRFLALVEEDFAQKRIRIQFKVPEAETVAIADQRVFHQVLLNLLTNAADALEKIEDPRIEIVVQPLHGAVQVQVIDNGCGLSESEQRNLFRPFYTSKSKGTGLGLVIVRKMLAKMNGAIRIDSSHGLGTTVTMTLPGEEHHQTAAKT